MQIKSHHVKSKSVISKLEECDTSIFSDIFFSKTGCNYSYKLVTQTASSSNFERPNIFLYHHAMTLKVKVLFQIIKSMISESVV